MTSDSVPAKVELNELVRRYWEETPNGTASAIAGARFGDAREWFAGIEERRYRLEPFIHSFAQFTRHRGRRVLEIGVGAGTDHLQWARAGAVCSGVDITQAAIDLTRERLALEGLRSDLRKADAEQIPFPDNHFDLVYSWGVIHHAEEPRAIVDEIRRVLIPGGRLLVMMYHRHSALSARLWARHALLRGRPDRSLADVLWNHMESIGTKAYTKRELRQMFRAFGDLRLWTVATPYDRERLPPSVGRLVPSSLGWFVVIEARKPE